MDELISINITIGERQYPLKIRKAEEDIVRHAEHLINEKFNDFQLRFTGQEKIDYLAMSALMNLIDQLRNQSGTLQEGELLQKKFAEAEALLTEAMKK